ncbi:MAG: hypothetical protein Fur0037_14530 [Planctomycetota bacterium]
MATRPILLSWLLLVTGPALAQAKSLLFTGRFPFVSLDSVNERPGGTITRLEEFDFSFVTPGPGAFARSLETSTAHEAYLAAAGGNGNYTKFYGLKTYFQNFQIASPFVRHSDKGSVTPDKVFFTVRSNAAPLQLEVFTNNGTSTAVVQPGDFVRFLPNGNVEYFITQALFAKAAGLPPTTGRSVLGASALCQDAQGNLYYSPPTGGHWINGNFGPPVFANDGSIVMIDAADITYDANGNVFDVVQNCAHLLFEEVAGGPGPNPLGVRGMVANAGGYDRTGNPIAVAGIFGKVAGLDLDPNGGTVTASFPDANNVFPAIPNLVFVSDAGSYAGTIFSTANGGSLASINGVLCGSNTLGVPANGSWLGVHLDVSNHQPSLMGLQVVDQIAYEPLVLDAPNFGALLDPSTQPLFELDSHGQIGQLVFLLIQLGPTAPSGMVPSIPAASFPFFGPDSFPQGFVGPGAVQLGVLAHDAFGYATLSFPNPNSSALQGRTFVIQSVGLTTSLVLGSPVLMQAK